MNVAICENEQRFCDAIKGCCETVLSDMGVPYAILAGFFFNWCYFRA